MALPYLPADHTLLDLPRYSEAERPAHLLPADELPLLGRRIPHSRRPDAWLADRSDHGCTYRPAYDPAGLEPLQAPPTGHSADQVDQHLTRMMTALDVKEMVARARHRAGLVEDRTLNGRLVRAKGKPYRTGHPLVLTVRATPCCCRLSEVAVRSLFDLVDERFLIRTEPGPACPADSHPTNAQSLPQVLPKLAQLVTNTAGGEDIIAWGQYPALALEAELALATEPEKRRKDHRLGTRWVDLQATEAIWRTGGNADDLAMFSPGADAAHDAQVLVRIIHRISDSHALLRYGADRVPEPTPEVQAATRALHFVLPADLAVGSPAEPAQTWSRTFPGHLLEGPTDTVRVGSARREQLQLRRWLLNNRADAPCALCGQSYPAAYLRAAHIKRRAEADEGERRDLAIGMLACTFGCDQMFELGDIFVDSDGVIQSRLKDEGSAVASAAARLVGRRCPAAVPERAEYFRHHRQAHGHDE